jgi:predicted cupin superfamily sugar epimerase
MLLPRGHDRRTKDNTSRWHRIEQKVWHVAQQIDIAASAVGADESEDEKKERTRRRGPASVRTKDVGVQLQNR